ncbi:secretin receptor [Trichinella spiralis]|uniref:Uncharacterized protein n=1 Tax=Trichinella spiralis TaxID=6334 RepID=E5S8Z8_TRISP|nr:secretin receptor [Trichinella spiralis]KRY42077.1 hypothetical protein T01_13373 [Trichinella spiralis]
MHGLGQQAVNAEITVASRGKALPVGRRCLDLPTAFKQQIPLTCVFCRIGAEYSIQRHANCPFGTITEQRICIDFARTVIVASHQRFTERATVLHRWKITNPYQFIMPSFYWHGFSLRGKHWLQFFVIPIPHLHLR